MCRHPCDCAQARLFQAELPGGHRLVGYAGNGTQLPLGQPVLLAQAFDVIRNRHRITPC